LQQVREKNVNKMKVKSFFFCSNFVDKSFKAFYFKLKCWLMHRKICMYVRLDSIVGEHDAEVYNSHIKRKNSHILLVSF